MNYVPAVDISVAVECDELRPAAPSHVVEVPPPTEPAAPATHELEGAAKAKQNLAELTVALNSAAADAPFRESFCTMYATAQLIARERDKGKNKDMTEATRLQKQHAALEALLGNRGRLVHTSLMTKFMESYLGLPMDDAVPSTRLHQTREGQAFVKARDSLQQTMACNCMYDKPTGRLHCCDSCTQDALTARF